MTVRATLTGLALFAFAASMPLTATQAQNDMPYPGTLTLDTGKPFEAYVDDLKAAISANRMGIVAQASATRGAASIGQTIDGNAVIMVFRPDFAVRMLEASVPAGIEAPIRFYVTEEADGSAMLTYRTPSSVFAPYEVEALDVMAAELDLIFEKIVGDSMD